MSGFEFETSNPSNSGARRPMSAASRAARNAHPETYEGYDERLAAFFRKVACRSERLGPCSYYQDRSSDEGKHPTDGWVHEEAIPWYGSGGRSPFVRVRPSAPVVAQIELVVFE